MSAPTYREFLAAKTARASEHGHRINPDDVHPSLHPFQRAIVTWAVRTGRAAVWADTGLGKTRIQLEWARLSGARALIVAPLAVCHQTVREAAAIGIDAHYKRAQDRHDDRIIVTNYEMLDRFDPGEFDAVVLDESSILKDVTSKTRDKLIAWGRHVPRRLACTATPSPNEVAELANHAEFLGASTRREMLSTYFVHDADGWRPKGHARAPMFTWMSTWAVALRRPSDIGYPDDGYRLPGLDIVPELVPVDLPVEGQLFATDLGGIGGRAKVRRSTLDTRVARALEIVSDCRTASCVQPAVVRGEPATRSGVPATHEGSPESATTRALRAGSAAPGAEDSAGRRVPPPQSERPAASAIQADTGPVRPDGPERLRDLPREFRGPNGSGPHRSRPPDGHGPRCALPALQPSAGTSSRRPDHRSVDVEVPPCRDQWVIWCGLNAEQDAIATALGSQCVSIHGRMSPEQKVELETQWREGRARIIVTKPEVFGFGMNWQHCHRMVFVGLSDSFEKYYQCLRRCYRYGQTRVVRAHVVLSDLEGQIAANVARKERDAARMVAELVAAMQSRRALQEET